MRTAVATPQVAPWQGIQWPRATVVILASGQSLTVDQCELVRCWRAHGDERRVIAINNTFQRAPWADVLYACDAPWWQQFHADARRRFAGEMWTQDERARREFGVKLVESVRSAGLGRQPGVIHQGGNSGYQAINLAYQAGAARILLLGFDMHGTHWHGKHEYGLPNTAPHLFATWIAAFDRLAQDLRAEGVQVRNCTPYSKLTCFDRADLWVELS